MAKVERSAPAEEDLIEIWSFIAADDPSAADRLLDRINDAFELLARNPKAGPRRDDLAKGLRFYPIGNYLVFYFPAEDGITVARVIHGARNYMEEFQ